MKVPNFSKTKSQLQCTVENSFRSFEFLQTNRPIKARFGESKRERKKNVSGLGPPSWRFRNLYFSMAIRYPDGWHSSNKEAPGRATGQWRWSNSNTKKNAKSVKGLSPLILSSVLFECISRKKKRMVRWESDPTEPIHEKRRHKTVAAKKKKLCA
jgi:hypothetical protein